MITGLRLLVVDPEVEDDELEPLRSAGLTVSLARLGTDALIDVGRFLPDAVLLAPCLADVSAPELVGAVRRRSALPILLALGDQPDLATVGEALILGATGTVGRPYSPREILRKVVPALPSSPPSGPAVVVGPLRIDPLAFSVGLAGAELPRLGLKEFQLLHHLAQRAESVVPHADLRRVLATERHPMLSRNAIAVHVRRLRSRLRPPVRVETVRGVGYRLTLDEATAGTAGPAVTAGGTAAAPSSRPRPRTPPRGT